MALQFGDVDVSSKRRKVIRSGLTNLEERFV